MAIQLCINCKKHVPKGIVVINDATTRVHDICKKAVTSVAVQDFVTGEKVIPALEPVLCRSINTAGACGNYAKKDVPPWTMVDPKEAPIVVED